MTPLERYKAIKRGEMSEDGIPIPQPVTDDKSKLFKRPGEFCAHPPELVKTVYGGITGSVTVCAACGANLKVSDSGGDSSEEGRYVDRTAKD
jgi:hypothetical protein